MPTTGISPSLAEWDKKDDMEKTDGECLASLVAKLESEDEEETLRMR